MEVEQALPELDDRLLRLAPEPGRAASNRASSAAGISRSRSSLQPNVIATMTIAARPKTTSHQMCQIAANPNDTAKKAMTKPVGLLRGNSIAS